MARPGGLARSARNLGWAGPLNYWPEKNRAKFGPARYGSARPGRPEFFFSLKKLFGLTGSVFRAGWAVKILAQKNRANFGPTRFWPGPLLARPSPARPARLPPLLTAQGGAQPGHQVRGSPPLGCQGTPHMGAPYLGATFGAHLGSPPTGAPLGAQHGRAPHEVLPPPPPLAPAPHGGDPPL